jgi:Beta-lactamase superfamily domain
VASRRTNATSALRCACRSPAPGPRSIATIWGAYRSEIGEILSIASEHDTVAGIALGANTIVVFAMEGIRVAHLGDSGQRRLRPEQREAIGQVDLVFVPVGGSGATLDGQGAARLVRELEPTWVIPMHFETEATDFLEPVDGFIAAMGGGERSSADTIEVDAADRSPGAMRPIALAGPVATGSSAVARNRYEATTPNGSSERPASLRSRFAISAISSGA